MDREITGARVEMMVKERERAEVQVRRLEGERDVWEAVYKRVLGQLRDRVGRGELDEVVAEGWERVRRERDELREGARGWEARRGERDEEMGALRTKVVELEGRAKEGCKLDERVGVKILEVFEGLKSEKAEVEFRLEIEKNLVEAGKAPRCWREVWEVLGRKEREIDVLKARLG